MMTQTPEDLSKECEAAAAELETAKTREAEAHETVEKFPSDIGRRHCTTADEFFASAQAEARSARARDELDNATAVRESCEKRVTHLFVEMVTLLKRRRAPPEAPDFAL